MTIYQHSVFFEDGEHSSLRRVYVFRSLVSRPWGVGSPGSRISREGVFVLVRVDIPFFHVTHGPSSMEKGLRIRNWERDDNNLFSYKRPKDKIILIFETWTVILIHCWSVLSWWRTWLWVDDTKGVVIFTSYSVMSKGRDCMLPPLQGGEGGRDFACSSSSCRLDHTHLSV